MLIPWRVSVRGIRAKTERSPKLAEANGNQGHGATTRALTAPLSTSFRSRVSTKMPCVGRAALGYNVLNVRIRTLKPQHREWQHLAPTDAALQESRFSPAAAGARGGIRQFVP